MTTIAIKLQGQTLTAEPDGPIVAQSVGQAICNIIADDSWADYAVTMVFSTAKIQKSVLYTGGTILVPWEVLVRPGYLWISAVGTGGDKRRPTALMQAPLEIVTNGAMTGSPPSEYTPALWEQAVQAAKAAQAAAEAAKEEADAASEAVSAFSDGFVIIGGTKPETGPVLWFNDGSGQTE